jgi:hypothetical protein
MHPNEALLVARLVRAEQQTLCLKKNHSARQQAVED